MQHVVVAVARTHAPTLGRCDPQYISFRSALIHERSIVAEQRVGGKAIGLVRLSSTVSMSVEHWIKLQAFHLTMACQLQSFVRHRARPATCNQARIFAYRKPLVRTAGSAALARRSNANRHNPLAP
jgi:hypothetical protein